MAASSSKLGILMRGCPIVKIPKFNSKSETGNISFW